MFPYSYDNRKNIYDGFSSELWTKWWWPRKNGVLFLVHNKLQRFNYVVLTAQVRLMAQHTDMRCHFSHYQFVRTFLILPSIECHKSPTSMYKKKLPNNALFRIPTCLLKCKCGQANNSKVSVNYNFYFMKLHRNKNRNHLATN